MVHRSSQWPMHLSLAKRQSLDLWLTQQLDTLVLFGQNLSGSTLPCLSSMNSALAHYCSFGPIHSVVFHSALQPTSKQISKTIKQRETSLKFNGNPTWLSVLIANSWSIVESTAPWFARSTASITSRSISGNIVLKSDIACANSNCSVDVIYLMNSNL